MVIADIFRPTSERAIIKAAYDAALVLVGSLFVALMARISIPLPFSPVPITGQTLAVLFWPALDWGAPGSH